MKNLCVNKCAFHQIKSRIGIVSLYRILLPELSAVGLHSSNEKYLLEIRSRIAKPFKET